MTTTDAQIGAAADDRRPSAPERPVVPTWQRVAQAVGLLVVAVLAVRAPFALEPSTNNLLSQVLYLAIAAQGLNLLIGYNGQVSIGHGAFFGLGAFTSAILVNDYGWSFEVTILAAAAAAAVLGVLVGVPALRVRGLYLALVTLGLAVLFPQLASKVVDALDAGVGGVALIRPRASNFDSLITSLDDDQYAYFLCLVVALVLFAMAWSLVHSRMGRAMISVRDQEIAASTVGVHLARVKVGAFAVSAAYAGVAGALSVMVTKVADATNPVTYFQLSIEFLVIMAIGGAATISGPIVGSLIVVFLRDAIQDRAQGNELWSPVIFGTALILFVYVLPGGLVGGVKRLNGWLLRRTAGPRPEAATNRTVHQTPQEETK